MPRDNHTEDRRVVDADNRQLMVMVRETPRPAPSVPYDASPTRQLCINEQWLAHLIGAIDALSEYWLWSGTLDDRDFAPQELSRLINDLINAGECDDCEGDILVVTIDEIVEAVCGCDGIQQIIQQNDDIINNQIVDAFERREDDTYQPVPDTLNDEKYSTQTGTSVDNPPDCNNDNAYAVAVAVVDFLAGEISQFFDAIEGADNTTEFISEIVDNLFFIPEANDAASDILDTITKISEYGRQAFENSYTPALRQEYICGLFDVIACNNCLYSVSDIIGYFEDRANILVGSNVFESLDLLVMNLDTIVTGNSNLTANAIFAMIARLQRGGNLLGVQTGGQKRLIKAFLSARDETNNDWTIQCGNPECTWQYIWTKGDDTSAFTSLLSLSTSGLWVVGATTIDSDSSRLSGNGGFDAFQLDAGAAAFVRFDVDYDALSDSGVVTRRTIRARLNNPDTDDTDVVLSENVQTQGSIIVASDNPQQTVSVGFLAGNDASPQTLDITKFTVKGVGVNPFI